MKKTSTGLILVRLKNMTHVRNRFYANFKCKTALQRYVMDEETDMVLKTYLDSFIVEGGYVFKVKDISQVRWINVDGKGYWLDIQTVKEDFLLEEPISASEFFPNREVVYNTIF